MQEPLNELPDLDDLLKLEVHARQKGSAIGLDSLNGSWKFVSVYKKGVDKEDYMSSFFLRNLSASLDLRVVDQSDQSLPIEIINSVKLGALNLVFKGQGELRGIQPMLSFFFDSLEVSISKIVLFKTSFDLTEEKDRPFFALISMPKARSWLAARGRGGGIAIWLNADVH